MLGIEASVVTCARSGDEFFLFYFVPRGYILYLLWGYFYESIELDCSRSIIQYKSEQGIFYSNLVRNLFPLCSWHLLEILHLLWLNLKV